MAAALAIAREHGGVAHRRQLHMAGIDRHTVRSFVRAGRWRSLGRHTVEILAAERSPAARAWWAVWESGSGACLDGVSSMIAHGVTGFHPECITVSVPRASTAYRLDGVRLRRPRLVVPALRPGIPRTALEDATIKAAQWAASDRQAALLLCLPLQQRLLSPDRLWQSWTEVSRSSRRSVIGGVLHDMCHGAQSLGELDFARWCRRYRLPEPARQTLRHGPRGRIYLDVDWPAHRLVVEIDGVHHGQGINPVWDALRANEVTLGDNRVLRLPVLGLRLMPQEFMAQVARALGATPVRMTVMPNAARGARSA